jgi:type VI secretion system secreted protein VgrG
MLSLRANSERCFFEIQGLDDEFHVVEFKGTEQLSTLYAFTLELVSDDPEIDLETLIGRAAVVTLQGQDQDQDAELQNRFIHGLISTAELGEQGTRLSHYHLTLVPRIWPLKYRVNSRIFQNLAVPEIIEQLLDDAGLSRDEYRFDLSESYPPREYCVQYRESELHFIQRLLEVEGIHYYYAHDDEKQVLVMSDASIGNPPIVGDPGIPFYNQTQGAIREAHIHKFRYRTSVVPGRVTLRDYDFKKPTLKLEVQNQGASDQTSGDQALEVYDYPASFGDPGHGKQRARVQLQAITGDSKQASGASGSNRLIPGYSFRLEEHARDDLNREYLVTQVKHDCRQPQVLEEESGTEGSSYSNKFLCIPYDVSYRPQCKSTPPEIRGSQTATVTGPSGEELYTDEFGRIKVQFHWDREGQGNEHSSCWIRVSQPSAGGGFGGFFLPRIGEEVIVDFLEGNPDRPLVIGRVYHGTNRPPYPLPEHKTKSTLKSNSSKGGDGYNELRFEDKKGEEQLFIHAEKDQDIRIKNDRREWVGNDRHEQVLAHSYSQVQGDQHHSVEGSRRSEVQQDDHLSVGGSRHTRIEQSELLQAGQEIHLKAGQKLVLDAGSELTLKAGGSFIKLDASGVSLSGAQLKLNSGGGPGSGSGASVEKPSLPADADTGLSGQVSTAKTPEIAPAANPLDISNAKASLYKAAQEGTMLVESCSHGEGCQCSIHPGGS